MTNPLTFPTIHLNGTPSERLIETLEAAERAVREAIDVVAEAAPHGRDYPPNGNYAYTAARHEHQDRLTRLGDVADEFYRIRVHLQAQVDERDAQRTTR